jgi:tetratricopeptide (TPR) repeat protein
MKQYLLKKFISIGLLLVILSFFGNAQSSSDTRIKDKNGNEMLWGVCTAEALRQAPYNAWFEKNYTAYHVDSSLDNRLRKGLQKKHYTIFFGTWCGDSQREVPRMLKILAHYGVQPQQIKLVAVSNHPDTYKQSPGREEKNLYIHRVPTLLVTKGKKELGRIIESPVESLEKDLVKIIDGLLYTPAYGEVAAVIDFIEHSAKKNLHTAIAVELPKWKESIKEIYHLNSVGYLLTTLNEWEKAITVFKICSQLFPADAAAYKKLAEIYMKQGDKEQAKVNYRKVLELEPGNEDAKKALE